MTILLATEKNFAAIDFTHLASCVSMAGGVILSCQKNEKGYEVTLDGVNLQALKDCGGRTLDISEISAIV